MAPLRALPSHPRLRDVRSDAQLVGTSSAWRRMGGRGARAQARARAVNGLALRLLGRDRDVDDVVQDSFASAFAALDRLADPQAFEAWLCGILVRTVSKLIRRRRLLARLGLGRAGTAIDLDTLVAPTVPQDDALELRRLYALAERLPADVRIPLLLQRVEGLGLDDIARLTGTSLATVKRRVAAAERSLRERFLQGDGR